MQKAVLRLYAIYNIIKSIPVYPSILMEFYPNIGSSLCPIPDCVPLPPSIPRGTEFCVNYSLTFLYILPHTTGRTLFNTQLSGHLGEIGMTKAIGKSLFLNKKENKIRT